MRGRCEEDGEVTWRTQKGAKSLALSAGAMGLFNDPSVELVDYFMRSSQTALTEKMRANADILRE